MAAAAAATRQQELTTRDLERIFGVTPMTIHLWRKGTATRSKLRTLRKKGRSVRYGADDVVAWAHKHNVPMLVHPDDLLHEATKPGPKPRQSA